jgi:hypothetical protein
MDDWRRLNSLPLRFNYKMRKADHQIISNYIVYFIFSHLYIRSLISLTESLCRILSKQYHTDEHATENEH